MVERRRHSRTRAFQAGSFPSPRIGGETHCVVRDLSEGGALLLLDEPRRAPSELALTLARGGGARPARVIWRGEAGIGVAFVPARDGADHRPAPVAPANLVSLDAARRARVGDSGPRRLADRIASVLHPRQLSEDRAAT